MDLPAELFAKITNKNDSIEKCSLNQFACKSEMAIRQRPEIPSYRPPYSRDADRIIHSLSYARYFDKTQVFFWMSSDMHQHRMLHVQLVSKIARSLANVLGLNQFLVEAISLGHDIGHAPFGHDGEDILSYLCQTHGIGKYCHNYGSVWFLQDIEMQNLSLPVLDGILGHNGESHSHLIKPEGPSALSWEKLNEEMSGVIAGHKVDPTPKTLEGALVRAVDTISYISRDVMDAEHLGILQFSDIPQFVKETLGNSNREIINTLSLDLIKNSFNSPHIAYSPPIFAALQELYQFNLSKIYNHPDKRAPLKVIGEAFKLLWDVYYDDLIQKRDNSKIFSDHLDLNLKQIRLRYPEMTRLDQYPYYQNSPEVIVRDFIAGMTDQYFWKCTHDLDPSLVIEKISAL